MPPDAKAGARRSAGLAATRGEETRRRILEQAFDVATCEGLEGLTIGRLAQALQLSKAGLFAHFGSKEELQLATIQTARDRWIARIVQPAMREPRGLARLIALYERNMLYAHDSEGGCFFAAASAEFDSRPGPVRDRIAELMREWLATQAKAVRLAIAEGHLRADVDPEQLAFELQALKLGANWARELLADERANARALRAAHARLATSATAKGQRILKEHPHASQSTRTN